MAIAAASHVGATDRHEYLLEKSKERTNESIDETNSP